MYMNFVPRMNYLELITGYKKIIREIYTTKPYYQRIRKLLLNYKYRYTRPFNFNIAHLKALIKSILIIGVINKGRSEYWKLVFWTLFNRPGLVAEAITFAIYGYHYRIVYGINAKEKGIKY